MEELEEQMSACLSVRWGGFRLAKGHHNTTSATYFGLWTPHFFSVNNILLCILTDWYSPSHLSQCGHPMRMVP